MDTTLLLQKTKPQNGKGNTNTEKHCATCNCQNVHIMYKNEDVKLNTIEN
jgi:hypothetical protein